jgi:putative membrane protein
MIPGYSDHAANERTFLAWVRTGIAVIAFGFVIEKFNFFLREIAGSTLGSAARQVSARNLSGLVGHYDGLALILGGAALIALSTVRFIRTTILLDDAAAHPIGSVRFELAVAAVLLVLVGGYCVYLGFA